MDRRFHPCLLCTPPWACISYDSVMLPKGGGRQPASAIEEQGGSRDTKAQSVNVSFLARQYGIRR
ncbi:hypothetical protein CaCOL14_005294 [Colletotrichum acutatum]